MYISIENDYQSRFSFYWNALSVSICFTKFSQRSSFHFTVTVRDLLFITRSLRNPDLRSKLSLYAQTSPRFAQNLAATLKETWFSLKQGFSS